jgi:hypothetical protein
MAVLLVYDSREQQSGQSAEGGNFHDFLAIPDRWRAGYGIGGIGFGTFFLKARTGCPMLLPSSLILLKF